jgi:phage I-like protein
MIETYAKRTGQKPADVEAWMAAETWMTAQDAKARGFSDDVSTDAPMAALSEGTVALLAQWYPSTPERLRLEAIAAPPSKEHRMDRILAMLGLAAGAAQAEVEKSLSGLVALSQSILTLTGKSTADEALGVLQAYKAGAEQTSKLQAEIGEIKASADKAERAGIIASALADGKLTPAQKTWAEAQPIASLRAFLEVAPKVVPEPKQEKVDPASSITASEAKVATMLGVKPEQLATYRKETSAK